MNQLAGPNGFALCGHRFVRGNEMQVGSVRHDLLARDGRLALILIPEKTRTLADFELIQHGLVRHRSPADGEIDRHERSATIIAINLLVQDARIEREMSERLEMELTLIESAVFRRSRGLLRLRRDQHTGWIGNGSVD